MVRGAVEPDRPGSDIEHPWSRPIETLLAAVQSGPAGLSAVEARSRLARFGANSLRSPDAAAWPALLLSQFKSPIVILLLVATVVSALLQDWVDAAIILVIVAGSAALSFSQEYRAGNAAEKLRSQVRVKATVLRGCYLTRPTCQHR